MTRLSIGLLGPLQISLDGQPVIAFKTQKVQALLAFLAVESAHPHRRDALTGLLWPEQPEEAARDNLRVSLYRLRQALDDPTHSFLGIKRDSVQFNARSGHWLDVAAFQALLAECRAHNHAQEDSCEECGARLAQATALYRGDFLAGVSLPDSAAFEEWVLIQRESLRRQALDALETLAAYHELRGEYDALC
nr:transcriptional regulator [Chloroflexota bacterium]